MTPLAQQLAKQLILPIRERETFWVEHSAALRAALEDTHFFEVTAAIPLYDELGVAFNRMDTESRVGFSNEYSFLPAPKTWIEFRMDGERSALLLEQNEKKTIATVSMFAEDFLEPAGQIFLTSDDKDDESAIILPSGRPPARSWIIPKVEDEFDLSPAGIQERIAIVAAHREAVMFAHGMLILINSPRIIGRRQNMPHRALEKQLTRALGAGKFPLHGWTEIKLEINKPPEIDDGESHEAHLTGRRALHFCRKHIRIRYGQLEYVSAHWRGDPALGIKRSRYTLVPPKAPNGPGSPAIH